MVAVSRDRVVLIGCVLLAHPRNEHVVYLKGGQLTNGFVVNLTFYRKRIFEVEGTVTLGRIEVDA